MPNPYLTQPLGRRVLTLIGIYVAFIFVIASSSGYSSLVVPLAIAELGGQEFYALASSIGGVLGVVLMPLLGYFVARYPHHRPLIFGLTIGVEVVATMARVIAPDIIVILVAGCLLVFGTAACYVVGLPLIRDMFPAQRAALLLGFVGTSSAIGQVGGPIAIGGIVDSFGWRAASYLIAPALAIAAILVLSGARISKEQAVSQQTTRFDLFGAIVLTVLTTSLVLPLSLGSGVVPYGSPLSNTLFAIAAVSLVVFALDIRAKKEAAFIPAAVFRDRNSLALSIQIFLAAGSSIIIFIFVPLYVLTVMGGTALEAGVAGSLFAIPGLFLAPLIGRWIGRTGTVAGVLYAGTAFKVIVMASLGIAMLVAPTAVSIWVIYAAMLLAGIYNAAQTVANQTGPQMMIKPALRVQGTAAVSVQITLGPIVGIAGFGGLVVGLGPATGVPAAILAAAVAALLALVPAAFLRPLTGEDSVQVAESKEKAVESAAAGELRVTVSQ